MRCARYKRVRSKFGGTVRRCASFSGGRGRSRGRRRGKYRRRAGMARKGSHCTRYKRVRIKGGGTARRCAKFAGGRGRVSGSRRYRRRGRRPFNKGKRCMRYGTAMRNGRPVRVCRSYGASGAWRTRGGRRSRGVPYEESVGTAYRSSQASARAYETGARRSWLKRLVGAA